MNFPFSRDKKIAIMYVLIGIFAYFVALALLKIEQERTLGSIFRHFLPTVPILFLIILINFYDIKRISFSSFVPSIPSNLGSKLILIRFAPILLLGLTFGLFTISFSLGDKGLLIGPLVVLLLVFLVVSCYLMMTEDKLFGVTIFLISIPFLYFLHGRESPFQFSFTVHQGFLINGVTVSYPAVYLILMSPFFLIGQLHNKDKELRGEETKFIKLCAVFLLMAAFPVVFSKDPARSLTYYLIDLFVPFIFFIILMKSIKGSEDLKRFMVALIVSAFLYEMFSLYIFYQKGTFLGITAYVYGINLREYTGFHFDYSLLALMIPLQICIYNSLKGWKKAIIGLCILLHIIYLFMSNVRAPILAIGIGFVVFYFLYYRIRLGIKIYFMALALLISITLILFFEGLVEKVGGVRVIESLQRLLMGDPVDVVFGVRSLIWGAAFEMIYDNPFVGIGPDMWDHYVWQYMSPLYWFPDSFGGGEWVYAAHSHNVYLSLWLNYGVLSCICFMVILYFAVRKGLRSIKKSSSSLMRNLSVSSFICLLVWITMSFFERTLSSDFSILTPLVFWYLIAALFKLDGFISTVKEAPVVSS